jgi:hypothetical protein
MTDDASAPMTILAGGMDYDEAIDLHTAIADKFRADGLAAR